MIEITFSKRIWLKKILKSVKIQLSSTVKTLLLPTLSQGQEKCPDPNRVYLYKNVKNEFVFVEQVYRKKLQRKEISCRRRYELNMILSMTEE